ncbi:MAG TPA: PDZ domain-containing protein, partial [Bacteroidota bacterium]|nr:PDZ domain-containing protein [Bacteroidota bacterium]
DYAEDVSGLKISGTRPGSAAEKAGLKDGDVIIKFKGKDIKNIYDFTNVLSECKPGDEVIIVVKRGTEEHSLTALLEARKQE